MVAARTTDTSEPLFKGTALEICMDNIRNYLPERAMAALNFMSEEATKPGK